jgi:hypothetical protein
MFNHFRLNRPEAEGDMQPDDDDARTEEYRRNCHPSIVYKNEDDEEEEEVEDKDKDKDE